ncbi:hypothetical protein NW761_002608 [Fusarium oxysporum]|uniref:Uncharacterized protein n=1 Tax=Fusarium oxysporum f. sp. pisi HDV247 TaxID=1080344 RepID=W9Q1Q8_FUSOX|nr:hypothetical protein FOVG_00073 [Fusarium oxysporum f. sp. pisi HDV247]KAJ4060564.1 hypothetical protein NW758_001108 [Fusarium oxysporum]KAJ4103807.1 hypothetical protein NW761_002608 [Fusarium oxysporum]
MAAKDPEFQIQCLNLIRGIKAAHEKQNDLLEKLVTLMVVPTIELKPAHQCEEYNDKATGGPLVQGDEVKFEKVVSSNDLSVTAQQDTNLDNILRFASHSYKKRLQLFETGQDGPQPFLLSSQLPPSQSSYTLPQQLEYIPRPPEDGDVVVNATQTWNYWYPRDWETHWSRNKSISPVPDFMPPWQLTRGENEKWYHIDDIDLEFPLTAPDTLPPVVGTYFEVPYSFFPGLRNLNMAYTRRQGITYGGSGDYLIEAALTEAHRYKIRQSLGDFYAVPQDGRLPLSFHTSELRMQVRHRRTRNDIDRSLNKYLEPTRELLSKLHWFTIIDLTAPGGSQNAVYSLRTKSSPFQHDSLPSRVEGPPCWEMIQPALQREGNGFVSYPSVIQDHPTQPIHREGRWCRVIQLDGLANITAGLMEEKCTRYNSMTVWKLLFQDNQLNSSKGRAFRATMNQHLLCRPSAKDLHGSENVPWRSFHISWYQLCTQPTDAAVKQSTWNYGRLYGEKGPYIKQQAFTLGCAYQELHGSGAKRDSFWTVLVMKSSAADFDPYDVHKVPRRTYPPQSDGRQYRSEDIILDAIRTSLQKAANAWSRMQVALDAIVDHDPLFLDPVQHDNLLFDDDTFSRSRQYFWIVSCLESFLILIDDAIEEWRRFRADWPHMIMEIDPAEESRTEETPEALTRRVVGEIEAQVDRLRIISARFEASRDKTKALREGLFSASGVIESRVSTRLGENVKLLTYVSIFYLPLSFCVALWSINEGYPRPMLALTSVLVAAVTFIVVANMRNMASVCAVAYRGVKRRIVRRMHGSEDEKWIKRATAFESYRPERMEVEPSEWYILYFFIYSMFSQAASWMKKQRRKVRNLFRSSERETTPVKQSPVVGSEPWATPSSW